MAADPKNNMNFTNFKKAATAVSVLAGLLVAAVAVSQGQSSTSASAAAVQKAVLARLAEIQDAAQTLDADKVFGFVMENDEGALAQNGRLILTRKDALDSTRRGFQGLEKVSYRFDSQHVTVLSPTVALAVGEGESSATLDGGRTIDTHFVQSVIFVLTNGDWKVVHSHRSFPPAQ